MLINTINGTLTINEFMKLLVSQKLSINHFKMSDGRYNKELINLHIPNVNKSKIVHILYYLILYPCYKNIVKEFCDKKLLNLIDCTIQPENIIDPLNYCHQDFIVILRNYGFNCNLDTLRNKFIEGILTHGMIKEYINVGIIDPIIFFSSVDYNIFINHMVLSIMAAMKSMTKEKVELITEQYMIGLALMFKHSRNPFTTQHFNKLLTCKDHLVIARVLKYITANPSHLFQIQPKLICLDKELVTEQIIQLVVNFYGLQRSK